MKKVLAICLAVILVASAGVLAFAQGGFVSSPSGNSAPTIEGVVPGNDSCTPRVVITAYADRETLDDAKEEELNKAYAEIGANADVSKLCPEIKDVTRISGVNYLNCSVSDLFDISVYHEAGCDGNHDIGAVKITLSADNLEKFVALIHRHSENDWKIVPDVVVDSDKGTLTFVSDEFSPFAIVINKDATTLPNTGSMIYIPAIAMVISAISLVAVLVSLKKKKA